MAPNNLSKTVLVVEDDPATSESFRSVLESQGYSVYTAANGAEGIERLKTLKKKPSVILLDLMMPDVNGWQFLDFQRSNEDVRQVPVIICSAYKESAKAVQPSAVLEKPVQLQALLDAVKAFCE